MKRFEIFFGIIKIPLDFFMAVLAFLVAFRLRLATSPYPFIAKPLDITTLPTTDEYFTFATYASLALISIFALGRMYVLKSTFRFPREIGRSVLLCGIWAMAIITYFFFTRSFPFSRLAMVYSWSLTLLFIIFGRAIIRVIQSYLLRNGLGQRKVLLIGNNSISKELSEKLIKNSNYQLIDIIAREKALDHLQKKLRKRKPDEIIQTDPNLTDSQTAQILEFCDLNHISYRFVPDLIDVHKTNINIETLDEIPIISLKPTPLDGWGRVVKRIMDVVGASILIILLSPIFLITALAIKIDSRGPIIFSRLDNGKPVKRIGQNAKPFRFYKFRSMKPNTDSLRYKELARQNTRNGGPLIKIKNDPRVTRVGRFLRKYSIDELPQLYSVLKGDLSLVGPRPHLPEEVSRYQKHHHFVFNIKPGVTGLAQISGRSDLDFEQEAKLDRYYIERWSILLDLKILLKTILVVLRGHQE